MAIGSLDLLSRLPEELLSIVLLKLSVKDLNSMTRVSKFFNEFTNDKRLWESKISELGITEWDRSLGAKQEIKIYWQLNKAQYQLVNQIIGRPISPKACSAIAPIHFIHTRNIVSDWKRRAPKASIVSGTKWESYLHRYINIMAFCIFDYSLRQKRILFVKELPDKSLSEDQKNYLWRLINNENCGSICCDWAGTPLEEKSRTVMRKDDDRSGKCIKRYQRSAVELCKLELDPTNQHLNPHSSSFILFGRFN